ncbi:hypothetical protein pb186bvf_006703 [Paramecium bursaria]
MLSKYVGDSGVPNIRQFKYNGQCDSILYEHVLSPFAQSIVNRLPLWLAPNLITLIGFLFVLVGLLLSLYYNLQFDQALPNWLCYYIGFSIFIIAMANRQNFHNILLARRTNSSSALGMLLDHGTDCFVQWIIGLLLIMAIRIEFTNLTFFAFLISAKISFYFGVYQQHYTGQFKLDRINAVDEGLPLIQLIFFITGYFGPTWWTEESFIGYKKNFLMLLFVYYAGSHTCLMFGVQVFKSMKWNPIKILYSLSLPLMMTLTYYFIAFYSENALKKYMQLYIAILGFQWTKMINLFQLSIITKEPFTQYNFSWLFIQFAIITNILAKHIIGTNLDELYFGIGLLLYSAVSYGLCVTSLITQLCDILKIKLLSIK